MSQINYSNAHILQVQDNSCSRAAISVISVENQEVVSLHDSLKNKDGQCEAVQSPMIFSKPKTEDIVIPNQYLSDQKAAKPL